jgi:hypothetical protein
MTDTYDVFISHASEDKETIVKPLAEELIKLGLNVWLDIFTLEVGDSLLESIDKGLANSRFGVIVLSPSFLSKGWTKYELRGLLTREMGKSKIVLPLWHNISREEILKISPTLADKIALDTSKQNLSEILQRLLKVIRPDIFENLTRYRMWIEANNDAESVYIPLSRLKPHPIRHSTLPDSLLIRIKIIDKILEEVDDRPLSESIQSFQRDSHPREEVQVWERIAAAYLDLTSEQSLLLGERRRIFRNLLSISMQSQEKIKEIFESGDDFIKNLILAYANVVPEIPTTNEN